MVLIDTPIMIDDGYFCLFCSSFLLVIKVEVNRKVMLRPNIITTVFYKILLNNYMIDV